MTELTKCMPIGKARPRKPIAKPGAARYRSRSAAGEVLLAIRSFGHSIRADIAEWRERRVMSRRPLRDRQPAVLKFNQGLRVLAAAVAGVVLTTFIVSRLYERTFISYPAEASYVAADTIVLLTPAAGQLQYIKADAAQGEPVFSLLQDDGRTISVDMPCDCLLTNLQASVGARVGSGIAIGEAIGRDPSIYVTAMLDIDRLLTLYGNPRIAVTFVDGETVPAVAGDLPRVSGLETSRSGMIRVKFNPVRKLSPAELGQPVVVAFDTFPGLMRSWSDHFTWLWPDSARAAGALSTLSVSGKSDREVSM